MSTACVIGTKRKDGTILGIYCHNDGMPRRVGYILYHHYSDLDRLNALIAGGDISSLGSRLNPDESYEHSFDNPQEDVTVFYGRDRGEGWTYCHYWESHSLQDFLSGDGISYHYLFDEDSGQWEVYDYEGARIPVPKEMVYGDEQ